MSYYRPETHRRQAVLVPSQSALLFIDVQNYNCNKQGAIYTSLSEEERQVSGGGGGGRRAGGGARR